MIKENSRPSATGDHGAPSGWWTENVDPRQQMYADGKFTGFAQQVYLHNQAGVPGTATDDQFTGLPRSQMVEDPMGCIGNFIPASRDAAAFAGGDLR